MRRSLPGAVVVGYLAHRGGRVTLLLNPRDDALVRQGDELVTLTGNTGGPPAEQQDRGLCFALCEWLQRSVDCREF